MADSKLSALAVASAPADADLIYVAQGVASKQTTRGALFTSTIKPGGAIIVANGVTSGYQAYELDGVTPATVICIKGGNNDNVIDPAGVSQFAVQIGQGGGSGGPNLFFRNQAIFYAESGNFAQDLLIAQIDGSNNLIFGGPGTGGATLQGDSYIKTSTAGTIHLTHGSTDTVTATYQSEFRTFGGSGGNGMSSKYLNGNLETQNFLVAAGGQLYLDFGGTGIRKVTGGVIQPQNAGSAGGWFQNTDGTKRNTAARTNATTTMANLSDLSAPLIAGRMYVGRLLLFANNSVGTDGLKLDFNGGTATMTNFQATVEETPVGATLGTTTSTAIGTALTFTAVGTGDAVYAVAISFVCNAAGTFIPRFAENTHTTGTATVELGSYLLLVDSPN